MQGYRTIIAGWVGAFAAPWLLTHAGIALSEEQKLYLVGAIGGGITHLMRLITKTPFGQAVRFNDIQVRFLLALIRRELQRANTPTKPRVDQ